MVPYNYISHYSVEPCRLVNTPKWRTSNLHDFVTSIWLIHIFYNENFVLKMDTLEANEGRLCLSGAIHPPLLWTMMNQFQNHFGTGLCQLHSQGQKVVMLGHNCIRGIVK